MSEQAIDLAAVKRGFGNPSLESQILFRTIMNAMSQPGTRHDVSTAPEPPQGINQATCGVALTLFDFETTVWIDPVLRSGEMDAWLRFHCNCPTTTETKAAEFAVVTDTANAPSLLSFNRGDPKYPESSTTIVLEVSSFDGGETKTISGPGIPGTRTVQPDGLPANFWQEQHENTLDFQLGVDLILTCGAEMIALPRTTRTGEA